jgi:hypothetical protein
MPGWLGGTATWRITPGCTAEVCATSVYRQAKQRNHLIVIKTHSATAHLQDEGHASQPHTKVLDHVILH